MTGKEVLAMIIKRILFISLIFFGLLTQAQNDITFTATGKQVVQEGERFRIVYELNADGNNFRNPNFGGLQVLSGPSTSTSSNIQYVNGRMSKSYTLSYSFVVQAGSKGEVQVGPASITVDGKVIQSNPLTVTVVAGAGNTQSNAGGQARGNTSDDSGIVQDDDVYITAKVNNTHPFLGEQIIVTYKIYTKVQVSNLQLEKVSSFEGFWSKSLMGDNAQYKQSTEIINGEEYITAEINRVALFPQKTGKLVLEPAEVSCTVQLRVQNTNRRSNDPFESFFNDPFFNRNVKNVETKLKSKPITIDVQPLPQKDKPDNFTGAVGDFRFNSQIDRTTLTANDAVTLTVEISGTGNIELLTLPEVRFPVDFETFEPKITTNDSPYTNGISGKKKFEFLAIPRNPGDFTVDAVTFSFFNPKTKSYHSYSSEPYQIKVEKGTGSNNDLTYSSSAKEDIRFIGKDIRHIKTEIEPLHQAGHYLFGSVIFIVMIVFIILASIVLILVWKRLEKQNANVSRVKNRKANKIARMRLQKAEKFKQSGNDKSFYEEMAQGIWGYIADKFNISMSELSIESVRETLHNKSVSDEITNNFIQLLNNIEFARFAPGDARDKMESVYNEAITAIMQAEKALK
ncbi:MAG: BatD family protein [Bacteroidales bacterium]